MGHVLLTGMTASHASSKANIRTVGYAGQIHETLSRAGHKVSWIDPSVKMDLETLEKYDSVLVGVAPVTALSANRAYGALSVIATLWNSPKLHLFIDAPNSGQITHSLSSTVKSPDSINKPFFSYRKEYNEVFEADIRLRVYTAVYNLHTRAWPKTLYPNLPWEQTDLETTLPAGASQKTHGLNLDYMAFLRPHLPASPDATLWGTDAPKDKWTQDIERSIDNPIVSLKSHRLSTDREVDDTMRVLLGALIAPAKDGRTWWSYRYSQALASGIPVVTEWHDSRSLGDDWTLLAPQIERLSDTVRWEIAKNQRIVYQNGILDANNATKTLETFLDI